MVDERTFELSLVGHSGRLDWRLHKRRLTDVWFDLDMLVVPGRRTPVASFRKQGSVRTTDLTQLAAYLRDHIGDDAPHELAESGCFVPLELDFSIRALSGEIDSHHDGDFSLQVMAVYMDPQLERSRVGVEFRVETAAVLAWCAELERLASRF